MGTALLQEEGGGGEYRANWEVKTVTKGVEFWISLKKNYLARAEN